VQVPGDKSISHRALILAACAVGETTIAGLLEADDVHRTAAALRQLGAEVERDEAGLWHVHGCGIGGLSEPDTVLDLGNSGTGARLLMGVMASHPFTTCFTGDASLVRRPMDRIVRPVEMMGARIVARSGCRLPLAVHGASSPVPITYAPPVPSAQVKSAVLLAGLNAPGETTLIERLPTRDHTERLLALFGAEVSVAAHEQGSAITVIGQPELKPGAIAVPGDPSSAAFIAVAGLIVPDSDITIEGVGVNSRRTGLFDCLCEMEGDIEFSARRIEGGEEVADIRVRSSRLRGIEVPAARVPSMIDEFPILAVAAVYASGPTVLSGIGELRVKESDRLAAIADGLVACGVCVEEREDALTIHGIAEAPAGGSRVVTLLDHRIAMSFLVLGMAARAPVIAEDGATIASSFPSFTELFNGLGAKLTAETP